MTREELAARYPDPPQIAPLAYPPETILTRKQLAEWLQVSEHTVKEWPLPRLKLPGSTVRYSAGMVLAYLEGRHGPRYYEEAG